MAEQGDVVMSPPLGATVEIEELQRLIADAHERGAVAAGAFERGRRGGRAVGAADAAS